MAKDDEACGTDRCTRLYIDIELVSGAISMGLGGYLAAKSEAEHYETEREREGKDTQRNDKGVRKDMWLWELEFTLR